MKRTTGTTNPPLYCLDAFGEKANDSLFYVETLPEHLSLHPFVSNSHRHDFYLILYITAGSGEHTIDFVSYPVHPNSFFLMTPGQVHSWSLAANTDGYILFFIPAFYQMRQREQVLTEYSFFQSINPSNHIQLTHHEPVIDIVMQEILKEYKDIQQLNIQLLRSYLDVILLKLAKSHQAHTNNEISQNTTFKLRKLEELINQHYRDLKQPSDYAVLMNLSASYLNNVCKKTVGKTLSDLIHDRVLLEAKRFFSYADLTISQVADKLNFSDPSYFIRFFKKHTGMTPEQFKEQINRPL